MLNCISEETLNSILTADLFYARDRLKMMCPVEKRDLFRLCLDDTKMNEEAQQTILSYLKRTGFFFSPASAKYHGNYEGGLFDHSFLMYLTLKKWTDLGVMKWKEKESPFLIGMLHDLCKVGNYLLEEEGYTYNKDHLSLGHHGLSSVVQAQSIVSLSEEEILCIRWHMGAYETDQWDNFSKAIEKYENVLWIHQADMYVSKVLGV